MDKNILEELVAKNLSQREIAKVLNVSQSTVKHWLKKHSLKTLPNKHTPYSGSQYGDNPDKYIEKECHRHGITTYIFQPSKRGYRCKRCTAAKVTNDRRKLKKMLVDKAGGKCIYCGYSKSIRSLIFHHRDPKTKYHNLAALIRDRNTAKCLEEIEKCDLVCSNCHGELEDQMYADEISGHHVYHNISKD